jgi:hypothetical protein
MEVDSGYAGGVETYSELLRDDVLDSGLVKFGTSISQGENARSAAADPGVCV